jgi:amino acid transporter
MLSVWDAVSLIVGIVIGSSIFKAPPTIFSNTASSAVALSLWAAGGLLSLAGALVYAELATTYPRCGGEYNYLSRAYGSWVGFLYAWSQLSVIQTGSIGAIAFVAAESAAALFGWPAATHPWLASTAVVVLTALNMAGLRLGAGVQNLLTVLKLVGLGAIIVAGLVAGQADPWTASQPPSEPVLALAAIFILYAYGGWSDAVYVAAEVRDLRRNIPRALIGGMTAVTVIYLLVNFAYLKGLGSDGASASQQPAADVLALWLGPRGGQAMQLLVMISALGGVNGLIFAVARLHATVGQDHHLFAWLGRFSRGEAPLASLVLQGAVTVGMILTVGTAAGQAAINRLATAVGFAAIPWADFGGGFSTLVSGSMTVFWLFFLLNSIGYFVLRVRDAKIERPFIAPGFPWLPLLFAASCAWMLYSAVSYAWLLIPVMSSPLLLGVPLYLVSRWRDSSTTDH